MITDIQSKRALAIDAAILLVQKYGYEKFRLSDVAKQIGVSHAALYKYFSSKEDLLDSINERWIHQIDQAIEAIVDSEADAESKIKSWALTLHGMKHEKVLSDIESFETLIASSYKDRPFIVNHLKLQDNFIEKMVHQAINEGVFKNEQAYIVTALKTAMMPFHHPVIVLQNAKTDRVPEIDYLLDALFTGFKPGK